VERLAAELLRLGEVSGRAARHLFEESRRGRKRSPLSRQRPGGCLFAFFPRAFIVSRTKRQATILLEAGAFTRGVEPMGRSERPCYVLGTGLSHSGSACLLKDGAIAVAIEKERLTRIKTDGNNDDVAVLYCLNAEGIALEDVELVVQNANFSMFERGNYWFMGPRRVARHPRIVTISHHLAHAYGALGTAPFDEMAVLVVDGCGNAYDQALDRDEARTLAPAHDPALDHLHFEKDSYYYFDGRRLQPIVKDYSPWGYALRDFPMCPPTTLHSIGGLYQAASYYCLGGIDDSGKLMGLAPYGRPGVYSDEIFELRDGRVFVNYEWMSRFNRPIRLAQDLRGNFQYYADIARWVQEELERALLYVADHRHGLYPSKNLAYAGGVALNAVANSRIRRESKFENLYVQPAAGDNGLAVGCAYYGWLSVLQRERRRHDGSSAFGRRYTMAEVIEAVTARAGRIEAVASTDVVAATASMLANGAIVGWFQGRSEFGPRALGHRSILADPRRQGLRDRINSQIKFREDFRPFAPSVAAEHAATYFDADFASPYMLLVAPIRPEHAGSFREVTHVDGSCRLQTVAAADEPTFHALLTAFARLTGVPVLLNTSFNRRGMPIVETPGEALDFFLQCALDVLVLETMVVRKRDRPAQGSPGAGQWGQIVVRG
jgi:carbamoyltransferase